MTTLTVNIRNDKDLSVLEELLNKLGLDFEVENDEEFTFSEGEIETFVKRKQEFIDGKTTARTLDEIENDLDRAHV